MSRSKGPSRSKLPKTMTTEQLAYLAGLIDGEGYVAVTRTRTGKTAKGCKRGVAYRLVVCVHMTDRRPLDFASLSTGYGTVSMRKKPPHGNRQPYSWTVWSGEAALLLGVLSPYLLVKREQAEVCIKFQNAMRYVGCAGLSDAEWNLREELWAQSKALNYGKKTGTFS